MHLGYACRHCIKSNRWVWFDEMTMELFEQIKIEYQSMFTVCKKSFLFVIFRTNPKSSIDVSEMCSTNSLWFAKTDMKIFVLWTNKCTRIKYQWINLKIDDMFDMYKWRKNQNGGSFEDTQSKYMPWSSVFTCYWVVCVWMLCMCSRDWAVCVHKWILFGLESTVWNWLAFI